MEMKDEMHIKKIHKATCVTEVISHKLKRRQYKLYCFSQLLDVSDYVS